MNNDFLRRTLWCTKCDLHKTRTNVVIGEGAKNADIIFTGEAPGVTEDKEGIPFCGRSGKLLRGLIAEAGLDMDKIYITNIIKCRPPKNRTPSEDELKACIPYLKEQVRYHNPKFVVGVGSTSATKMLDDFKISRDHGKIFTKNGIRIMGIYHPAYILRNRSKNSDLLEDLKKLKKELDS